MGLMMSGFQRVLRLCRYCHRCQISFQKRIVLKLGIITLGSGIGLWLARLYGSEVCDTGGLLRCVSTVRLVKRVWRMPLTIRSLLVCGAVFCLGLVWNR